MSNKRLYTAEEVARILQGVTDEKFFQENLECEILTRENEGDAIEEENYDEEECDAETDLFEVSSNENKSCCDKTLINSVADKAGCAQVHSFEEGVDGEFEHRVVDDYLGSNNIVQEMGKDVDVSEGEYPKPPIALSPYTVLTLTSNSFIPLLSDSTVFDE